MSRITLTNAEQRALEYPETFFIPELEVRTHLLPGEFVKLGFERATTDEGERMWVHVDRVLSTGVFEGTLRNQPVRFQGDLAFGATVRFRPEHVMQVMTPEELAAQRGS